MKEKKYTLMINGKPFVYNGYVITPETANQITFNQAKDILFTLKQKFEEKGLTFFLIFGTLLGAVRERSFISHDYDVDVATGDYDRILQYIPEWYEEGFKICRHNDTFMSFMKNGVYIDVYRYQKLAPPILYRPWCCQIDINIMPKSFFKEFVYLEFLDDKFLVPKNPEKLMRWIYGETWRIPIKGAQGKYDVWSIYYWRKTKVFLAKYIGRKKIKKMINKIFN